MKVRNLLDSLFHGYPVGFLIAWRLSAWADGRMSAVFSEFWHQQQASLREALKGARRRMYEGTRDSR